MVRLRILFLAYDVKMPSQAGDSVHVRRLSEELVKLPGCDLKVICRQTTAELKKTELYTPIVFPRVFSPVFAFMKSLRLWRANQFNIVYERGGTRSVGLLLSRIFRVPFVLEADGFIFQNQESHSGSSVINIQLTKFAESMVYRAADLVIAESDSMVEVLVRDLGVRRDRVKIVPIGADIQVPECGPQRPDRKFSAEDPLRLCYVGAITEWHGLGTIVEAFGRSSVLRSTARVTMIGEGYYRKPLMKRVAELGLSAHIDLPGEVPHDQIARILMESDACLAPQVRSRSVPSIKVMEYMAVGRPIIASMVPDHDVIEREQVGILFNAGNPLDFADKVSILLSNYSDYSQKAARGTILIKESHNWRNTASGVCAILSEVVSKGNPNAANGDG